jgi:uncharacterized protein (UPF0335 family)
MSADARASLRDYFKRLRNIDAEVEAYSQDRAEVMRAAREAGFDVKAMRVVLQRRRQDPLDLAERDRFVEMYEKVIDATGDDA